MPIRVLLADDSAILCRGIRQLLAGQTEIEIVAVAANFAQTIRLANDVKPQVIVLDLHMPDDTKITSQGLKLRLNHGSQLLAISFSNDMETKVLAESFGAAVLLDKTDLANTLIPTIVRLCRERGLAAETVEALG